MQEHEIKIFVKYYSELDELTEDDRQLILAARQAALKAYAPYSGFKVGAAIRMADSRMVTGNNQENASSPVGSCAERTALFWANANNPEVAVLSVAVTAVDRLGNRPASLSPCGVCRQALLETEIRFSQPIRVLLDCLGGIAVLDNIESLLPLCFKGSSFQSSDQNG
jgi:cytidine deaminase